MAHDLIMRKKLGALRPADALGEEALADLPEGKDLRVKITMPRLGWRHNKFFALLAAVFPHQHDYPTPELLRKKLQRAIGLQDVVYFKGEREVYDRSIAWDKMDELEFRHVFDRMVQVICEQIIPNVGRADLEREVEDILAGRRAA